MVKFVCGNTINTPVNHLWKQFSSTIKQLQKKFLQVECHHLFTVNLGLIENAKNMTEGKSVFITKQAEQA